MKNKKRLFKNPKGFKEEEKQVEEIIMLDYTNKDDNIIIETTNTDLIPTAKPNRDNIEGIKSLFGGFIPPNEIDEFITANELRTPPKDITIEKKKELFKKEWYFGLTMVIWYNDEFYFWGDVAHNGIVCIFNNARKIRDTMMQDGFSLGYKTYDDFPSFFKEYNWDDIERKRNQYGSILYKLQGNKVTEVDENEIRN